MLDKRIAKEVPFTNYSLYLLSLSLSSLVHSSQKSQMNLILRCLNDLKWAVVVSELRKDAITDLRNIDWKFSFFASKFPFQWCCFEVVGEARRAISASRKAGWSTTLALICSLTAQERASTAISHGNIVWTIGAESSSSLWFDEIKLQRVRIVKFRSSENVNEFRWTSSVAAHKDHL